MAQIDASQTTVTVSPDSDAETAISSAVSIVLSTWVGSSTSDAHDIFNSRSKLPPRDAAVSSADSMWVSARERSPCCATWNARTL